MTLDILKKEIETAYGERKAKLQYKEKCIVEFIKKLVECKTRRKEVAPWSDPGIDALLIEHRRHAFAGIFSQMQRESAIVLSSQKLETDSSIFSHEISKLVQRTKAMLLDVLKPMLESSSEVTFVDPHFSVKDRFIDVYKSWFSCIGKMQYIRRNTAIPIRIITTPRDEKQHIISFFENQFKYSIQHHLSIEIFFINEHCEQQEIHNRYIITDIGGVFLGHGTDCSTSKCRETYDDISIMSNSQYLFRKNMYTPNSKDFQWPQHPDWKS